MSVFYWTAQGILHRISTTEQGEYLDRALAKPQEVGKSATDIWEV